MRRVVHTSADQQAKAEGHASGQFVDQAAGRTVARNRRVVRPQELMESVRRLDTTTDPAVAQAIMKWINDEYDARQGGRILGLFGRCYLGEPYVDHRLDLSGECIVEHFSQVESPPGPFLAARPLARNSAYAFIEVYDDGSVIPVREDGRPVI